MRILIVEDEPTSRKLLTTFMVEYGQCDQAVDGIECVEMFKRSVEEGVPYDLIFLDIMMPNKDGNQALKEIRDYERVLGVDPASEVKVIMVTALNDPKSMVRAYYKGGAAAYLTKPVEMDHLLDKLRELDIID